MSGDLNTAADALCAGAIVVYPTETLYGLGADATSATALARLLDLKGRDAVKGVSVLVADLDAARTLLATEPPPGARALAAKFWPGPLTLVLEAAASLPGALRGPSGGVGLRCSPDPVARALLARAARPLTATSANPSGRPPAATIEQARAYFGARVAVYLDGGPRASSAASTVVEFSQARAYLRRTGAIALDALRAVTEIEPAGV